MSPDESWGGLLGFLHQGEDVQLAWGPKFGQVWANLGPLLAFLRPDVELPPSKPKYFRCPTRVALCRAADGEGWLSKTVGLIFSPKKGKNKAKPVCKLPRDARCHGRSISRRYGRSISHPAPLPRQRGLPLPARRRKKNQKSNK